MKNGTKDLLAVAKEELRLREKVVWHCQPNAFRRMFLAFGTWLFMVPWTGISSYFVYKLTLQESIEPVAFLFSLLFPAVGLLVMFTPFYEWAKAKKTIYIVTNQRVFIIEYLRTLKVMNIDLDKISNIEKKISTSGYGDLILYRDFYLDSDKDKKEKEHGFFAIPDVREAEKHISKLLESTEFAKQKVSSQTGCTTSSKRLSDEPEEHSQETNEHQLAEQLIELYLKHNLAEGSRRYVLQVKITELLDKKKGSGITLTNQDITFLSEISADEGKLHFHTLVNPRLIAGVTVAGIVLLFLFKAN